jgi:hypothetical protein
VDGEAVLDKFGAAQAAWSLFRHRWILIICSVSASQD